jgi:hypothetical protein
MCADGAAGSRRLHDVCGQMNPVMTGFVMFAVTCGQRRSRVVREGANVRVGVIQVAGPDLERTLGVARAHRPDPILHLVPCDVGTGKSISPLHRTALLSFAML